MKIPSFVIVIACTCLMVSESNAMGRAGSGSAIVSPAFSPGGEALVFGECRGSSGCGLGFLDLVTAQRKFVAAPRGREFSEPAFSPDGSQIVAISHETPIQTQLAIMDADGGNFRELTTGRGCRSAPSFSPDGKRVIFIFSSLPETLSTKKCVEEDVYELELSTGEIRRLTNFEFYLAGSPHYLPDGKRFVFYGDGPTAIMKPGEYEELYGENYIFIMGDGNYELRPAITGYDYSKSPSISADGKIVFKVRTNKIDGIIGKYNYDLFLRSDGRDIRLTKLKAAVASFAISANGKRVVLQVDPQRNGRYEMMIMNADGTGLRSLGISGRLWGG